MDYKTKDTDVLFEILSKLKTKKECFDFFYDLCNIKEIIDMSKRFKAAVLLNNNEKYNDIIEKVNISTATLSRVKNSLNYGSGGYKKAISLLTS